MRLFGVFLLLSLFTADSGWTASVTSSASSSESSSESSETSSGQKSRSRTNAAVPTRVRDQTNKLYLMGGNKGWTSGGPYRRPIRPGKPSHGGLRWYWGKEASNPDDALTTNKFHTLIRGTNWKGPEYRDNCAIMEAPQPFDLKGVNKEVFNSMFDTTESSGGMWVGLVILTGAYRGLFHFLVKSSSSCDVVLEDLTGGSNGGPITIEKIAVEWWTFDADYISLNHYESIDPAGWNRARDQLFAHLKPEMRRFTTTNAGQFNHPVQCAGVAHTLEKKFYDGWPYVKNLEFRAGKMTKTLSFATISDTASLLDLVLKRRGAQGLDRFSISVSGKKLWFSRGAMRPKTTTYYLDGDWMNLMNAFVESLTPSSRYFTSSENPAPIYVLRQEPFERFKKDATARVSFRHRDISTTRL